jgi:hypothetical protein
VTPSARFACARLSGQKCRAMTRELLPESVTPAGLTLVLRRFGILDDDRVTAVEAENPRSTILSRIVRLRLAYQGEAPGAQRSLIFKTSLPERLTGGWNAGRQEVEFYAKVAAATPPGFCLDVSRRNGTPTRTTGESCSKISESRIRSLRLGRCRPLSESAKSSFAPGRDSTRIGGTTLASASRSAAGATPRLSTTSCSGSSARSRSSKSGSAIASRPGEKTSTGHCSIARGV